MARATPELAGTHTAETPLSHELVVLLDERGRASGTLPKYATHHTDTPFHLAFSCHVVDTSGRVLLTRRAAAKPTWPATWTNACCGHPAPGETLRQAATRRLAEELGLVPLRMGLALPDFAYRAERDGMVEHELCPVIFAEVAGEPTAAPAEVDDVAWTTWAQLCERARRHPDSLSPWCVRQVARLARLAPTPRDWLDAQVPPGGDDPGAPGTPATLGLAATPATAAGAGGAGSAAIGLDVPPGAGWADGPGPGSGADAPGGTGPRTGACGALDAIREPLDGVLAAFLDERDRESELVGPPALELAGEVRALVAAGGKRLRPAFTYWGHRATGAPHDDRVVRVAGAVELLHTFALLHDDVMDRSEQRRGRPAAHVALARRHEAAGLGGDGAWFGISAALLAGDLAFVWADQLLESAALPEDAMTRARRVFSTLRSEVVGGQALDLHLAHAGSADDAAAQRVALLKSARYTVTRPLQLGAVLAYRPPGADGPDPATIGRTLVDYGDAVGLAFQMRDDVLGLFGDPEVTGKSRLDDLREGKRTVLVLRALDLASGDDRRVLAGALGDPDLDEATAARCRRIVARSGALASVEALIEHRLAVARHAVAALDDPARGALAELAGLAVRRDA
jgi:isopentenyl-diphosphate delta-isomerase type 1